jgi:hypothetical protein
MDDGYETARSLPELLDQRPLGRLLRAGSRRIGMWRIGILMSASENDTGYQGLLATFRYELKKLGREEGRNIRMRRREFLGVLSLGSIAAHSIRRMCAADDAGDRIAYWLCAGAGGTPH